MKISVRKSVFETNSSSTHAMTIANTDKNIKIDEKTVVFSLDEYGWEHRVLRTPSEKGSYLFTALWLNIESTYYNEKDKSIEIKEKEKLKNIIRDKLKRINVSCVFNDEKNDYYIDHDYDISDDFLNRALEHLDRFLFSTDSIVITANDGSEYSVYLYDNNDNNDNNDYVDSWEYFEELTKNLDCKVFYKGN